MQAKPGQILLDLRKGCGRMRSFVTAVPASIRLRHSRIIEPRLEPLVRFNMTICKSEHRRATMLISGNVVNVVAIHVHPELRTTNAVGMKFTENKYVSRSPDRTRLSKNLITAAGLIVIGRTLPSHEGVHPVTAGSIVADRTRS